ncbi:MAG TPA: amino acid permease [Candidatus Dormibacteraeota bacterium]|nr:amino acid permease [Candidatus Dormibacteraeota bacterium]
MPALTKEEQIRADTARLHQMGYAQQLFRDMGGFSNFAISFTIISVLTGGLTLYSYGLIHGGPQQMGIGWLLVGVMVLVVAAAMAQLASALPTAGALYYQAAKLGNKHWGWITGWFNLIGQVTITTGIVYGNALFAAALLNALWNYPSDVTTTAGKVGVISIFAILLAVQATINHVGVRLAARAADISVWWHIGVIAVLLVAVGILHPLHPISYAFTQSYNNSGFGSPIYAFLVGLLLAQWTFTGYDASAHVTEETVNPARRAPWGIMNSVFWSLIFGYLMLLALTLAIPDLAKTAASSNPVLDIVKKALGTNGGLLLFFGFVMAQAFCGLSSITSNSRMLFAFSRDGALPGSKWLHVVSKKFRTPARAIWVAAIVAFIPALAQFPVPAIYSIVVSISVIGLYVSYVIPVLLALIYPNRWKPGPWNLGRYWPIVAWVAIIWVAFISIVLMLPEYSASFTGWGLADLTAYLTNAGLWAGPAVAIFIIVGGLYYLLWGKNHYNGPIIMGSEDDMRRMEQDVEKGSIYHEPTVTEPAPTLTPQRV